MMLWALVLGFSLLGCIGSLVGAGLLMAFPALHARLRMTLLAFAVGTLLGATFLGLLPSAIARHEARGVLATTLAGFVGFFLLEKVLRVPHVHGHAGVHPVRPAGTLILWGDALHNFVDGVVIATAFSVSVPLGLVTSLAVVAHEIPQELGDFVILLESGWDRATAFRMNALSALATVPGALLAFGVMDQIQPLVPFLLALSAASFLYVAATDLAPILHHEVGLRQNLWQAIAILGGIGTLWALHALLG